MMTLRIKGSTAGPTPRSPIAGTLTTDEAIQTGDRDGAAPIGGFLSVSLLKFCTKLDDGWGTAPGRIAESAQRECGDQQDSRADNYRDVERFELQHTAPPSDAGRSPAASTYCRLKLRRRPSSART